MGDIHAAVRCGHFTDFDQLGGLCIAAGRIDKGRADAQGAVFHGLADERLHFFQLGRIRVFIGESEQVFPYGGCADERGYVCGYAFFLQVLKIIFERCPGDGVFYITFFALFDLFHGVRIGAFGTAFAEDLEGDALVNSSHRPAVL
jgi:hypothetical protein